ncbi:MAG: ATP-dependent metallopeptidase FtsH/Yme1/Tma family protein [Firmicutes bacterium]|nr:ATP-dependent metallopeptidase FtsH/Yme1/Tma family protein [Bacillota bacterium]
MNPFMRHATFYLLIAIVVIALISYFQGREEIPRVDYIPNFIDMVEKQEIRKVVLEGMDIKAELRKETEIDGKVVKKIKTTKPDDDNLTERLEAKNIQFEAREVSTPWWSALTYMIPFVLLIGLFFFFMQQTQGGGSRVMNFGKSKARLHDPDRTRVTFNDVAGADEEKAELEEIVGFLKDPKKYISIGARIPKGVLLVGPPGTGKTLLARAVAGEADVPFFSISGSDFVEMFVGVGASRVRDLFENARKNFPCIVFIDEIDAVGRQRGAGLGGGHDEREQTLNQLLVEMDGFDVNEGIIILAATNRPDILDPALLRPGRFDRQVTVNYPDVRGREGILKVHSRKKPLDETVDLKVIARRTPGFTGADLENVMNEAALLTARSNKQYIGMEEIEAAIDRVVAGTEKKSRVISDFEKKLVAFHESGHALVGYLLPNTDPVHKVSIIPRGRAGGFTLMLPEEDRYYMTRSELLDRVSTLLAGRVAEEVVLNEVSTGAQNDLERATSIVRQMIMEYGMSDKLGPITLGKKNDQVFLGRDFAHDRNFSEDIAKAIDKEIRLTVDRCYHRAREIIEENRDKLDELAAALIEKETLDSDEIAAIIEGKTIEEIEVERKAREKDNFQNVKSSFRNISGGIGQDHPLENTEHTEDTISPSFDPDD